MEKNEPKPPGRLILDKFVIKENIAWAQEVSEKVAKLWSKTKDQSLFQEIENFKEEFKKKHPDDWQKYILLHAIGGSTVKKGTELKLGNQDTSNEEIQKFIVGLEKKVNLAEEKLPKSQQDPQ